MKKIFAFAVLSVFIFLLTGCPVGYKYDTGKFPADPVNFAVVNSIYDDYNSTAPFIESERYLYFSSNRNSSGGEFDIIGSGFRILWDKETGRLYVDNKPSSWKDYNYTDNLFSMINTGANEFGPYSMPYLNYVSNSYYYTDLIVFSNDESGNHDLKYVYFKGNGENPAPEDGVFFGPEDISMVNSAYDDSYLTFYGPGFIKWDYISVFPGTFTEMLFCSNRSGNFDIYQVDIPSEAEILEFLGRDTPADVVPAGVLNSDYDDKCPYADGELLVFASNRPGGFGGFDLYYSRRNGNAWSEPVNFGNRINTEHDEYRPIVTRYYEFENDLMLFSSNRPGGKGGFDLYYVGIQRMIE